MDFSTPSVKQVSDFFMYLYQDLNRRPSTIDGYRTAIVDTIGPAGLPISKSSDLNRLLSSFHRDRHKSFRNLPKWNLSVLLGLLWYTVMVHSQLGIRPVLNVLFFLDVGLPRKIGVPHGKLVAYKSYILLR